MIELRPISNQLATTLATSKLPELATSKQPHKQPVAPCSSSTSPARAFLQTTTEATEITPDELPDEWMKVDFKPINSLGERMGKQHLDTLFKSGKTSPEKVQESVNRIAFAVRNKTQVIKKTPTAMLMGLLPKGKEFDPPKGYYKAVVKSKFDDETNDIGSEESSTEDDKKKAEEARHRLQIGGFFHGMPKT